MQAPLIGLCGLAQSGKDTFASFLPEYRRIAFADPLKELALAIDPLTDNGDEWPVSLAHLVESRGWEGAKATVPGLSFSCRSYLQRIGVAVRDVLGTDTWVDAAFRNYDLTVPTVFTDCRFPNEFRAIRSRGGMIVRIERVGQTSGDGHVSETGWQSLEPDYTVRADEGDLAALEYAALSVAKLAALLLK